ncbi:MAG TPA: MlaD family protein [Saprospiraceae bacterium]|nr:MlaD family protein [Saprospiraceae bacterium]
MSNEIKIGILATAAILISIFGYKFLKGHNVFGNSNEFYVEYKVVDQLTKSSPVFISGFQVGVVRNIYIKPEDQLSIVVVLEINPEISIPKNTVAAIRPSGIVGGKIVELIFDKPCAGDNCAKSGDYLKGVNQGYLDAMVGKEQLNSYLKVLKEGLVGIYDTLAAKAEGPDGQNQLQKTIKDINVIVQNLKTSTNNIRIITDATANSFPSIMGNLDGITKNLKTNNDKISAIIKNTEAITSNFQKVDIAKTNESVQLTLKNLDNTLSSTQVAMADLKKITSEINSGSGTMGKLIKDPQLYDNLNHTSKNLDLLLQDFRLNPKRYVNVSVFGKKQKDYAVPEKDPAYIGLPKN